MRQIENEKTRWIRYLFIKEGQEFYHLGIKYKKDSIITGDASSVYARAYDSDDIEWMQSGIRLNDEQIVKAIINENKGE